MSDTAKMIKQNALDTVRVIDTMSVLLNKFASDNCELQEMLAKQQQQMEKQASAPATIEFDEKLMAKAAAAVCSSYGSNPSLTPEVLTDVWKREPNKLLNNICKMASDLASAAVAGGHIGVGETPKAEQSSRGMAFGSDRYALFDECYNK